MTRAVEAAKRIFIFGSFATSGKTMTCLGLLKALHVGSMASRQSLYFMRLANELTDINTVKQVHPTIKLLKDSPENLERLSLPDSIQLIETNDGVLSLRDGMPQAHQLSSLLQSKSSTAILVTGAPTISPSAHAKSLDGYSFSSTLLAYESLLNRDFDVGAIVCYSNHPETSLLGKELSRFVNIPILNIQKPRELKNEPLLDYTNTMVWLEENENKFRKLAGNLGIL